MDNLKQLFARFLLFWANLKTWQKASIYAAIFGVLSLLVFMVFMAGRSGYEELYTNLHPTDETAVLGYLRENGIPHQIDSPTKTVFVPREQVYAVRLALAEQGFPKRGASPGLELFDNESIMGDTNKRIAFLRARQGELERTIAMLAPVEEVKVNLVIPEPYIFLKERESATASVLVVLRPGMQLTQPQVRSIVHLVAGSVEGLTPDRVTLVNALGQVLSDMLTEDWILHDVSGQGTVTSVQREMERQREAELETKLRSRLSGAWGAGNVIVGVSVTLDFNRETVKLTEYIPLPDTTTGVTRSRQQGEENWTGETTPPNGQPGTTTNIPGYAVNTQATNNEYSKTDGTTNYEITTQENSRVVTPGTIKRVTASILVNGSSEEAQLAILRDTAVGILGYREDRGDVLNVNAMQFDTTLADQLTAEIQKDRMLRIAVGAFIALLVLAVVIMTTLWWLRRRRARAALTVVETETKRVPTIQEMLTSPDLLAFQGEMAVLEEQLKAYARSNPGEVANLVNEWISSADA